VVSSESYRIPNHYTHERLASVNVSKVVGSAFPLLRARLS
jgi:hypothetical protein